MTQTYSKLEPPAPPKFNPPGGSEFIRQGHVLVRLAGLSGAAAVALGAYGAHGKPALELIYKFYANKYLSAVRFGACKLM